MINLNIQKETAIKRIKIIYSLQGIIIFLIYILSTRIGFGGYVFFICLVMEIFYFLFYMDSKIKIESLEYSINEEEGVLTNSWKNIFGVKNKDSSRLQVVNNVNINQTLWDKLFELYSVEVDYGFSSEGYTHNFNYLSEIDAESIVDKIKPKSNSKIILK